MGAAICQEGRKAIKALALSLLLLSVLLTGLASHFTLGRGSPALAAVSGDVNCDQTVNSVDALGVLRSTAGLSTPACIDAADVSCDDAVNSIDSLFILRYVAGLPANLPGGCPPIGTAPGLPLLNEVLFLPSQGDFQFVELKNGGSGAASLDGLSLADESNQTFALPEGLPELGADEVLLILFDGGNSAAGNVVHASPEGFLDSGSGSVELRDGDELLDRVAWGDEQLDRVNVGSGGVVSELKEGSTIGRAPGATEVSFFVWAAYTAAGATPGVPNPAPGAGILLPLEGAVLTSSSLDLDWYSVPGAEEYRVQVSEDAAFASPTTDDTVAEPGLTVGPRAPGDYYWRVQAIGPGGVSAAFSAVHSLTISAGPGSARVAAASAQLTVPVIYQHKDTPMLLLEHGLETGQHAWDRDHGDYHSADPADNMNCVLAVLAMLNKFLGGNISQDRLGFELRKNNSPGPEVDLNYGQGVTPFEVEILMKFAIGPDAVVIEGGNKDENWDFVTGAIDGGMPIGASVRGSTGGDKFLSGGHAFLITGYYEEGGARYVRINDPISGPYDFDFDANDIIDFWGPGEKVQPASDEPGIHQDSDGDGMVDFDETERFGTSPAIADTDSDGIQDKADVAANVFDELYGWAHDWQDGANPESLRDWDSDGLRAERDCDSDNDGVNDAEDDDDFTDPPGGQPATCGSGSAAVTVSWNADSDLDVWILPNPANSDEEAITQFELPGYDFDQDADCLLPSSQTQRTAEVEDVSADAHYVGVFIFSGCMRPPDGPDGDGPNTVSFTLTVRLPSGGVQQFGDTITKETDGWRLYGPFNFAGAQEVRLTWNSVTDLNLFVLPLPAIGESQAYAQHLLPGYGDDVDYECWLVPDSVTQREAVVTDVTVDAKYVGVYFNHKCPYNPEGPHGSSDYVLTVSFADGRVEVYSDFLSRDVNRPGEFWRLYGPFNFASAP